MDKTSLKNLCNQLTITCGRIGALVEEEGFPIFDEMIADEVHHVQLITLEMTKAVTDGTEAIEEEPAPDTDDKAESQAETFDSAFFAGELTSEMGEKPKEKEEE